MKAHRRGQSRGPGRQTSAASSPRNGLVTFLAAESSLIAVVSLVVIVFLCYANSLGNDFVFDDIYLVVQNQHLRSFDVRYLLNSYRPMRDITYALDFALWGEGPFGFHLTNILIHAANVLLVFALIKRLTKDLIVAFLAALIFAVHPIQTDAVTYISGRRDLLFSFFYLLAFHSYLSYFNSRSRRATIYALLFLGSWALSLLSKEMAASLPFLIFVWHFCEMWEQSDVVWWRRLLPTARKSFERDKWFWLVILVGGVAFTGYWVLVKGASRKVIGTHFQYWGGSFYLNLLTVIRVHAWYLKQLVYPTPIAQYLGAFPVSETIFDWSLVWSLAAVSLILAIGFWSLRKNRLLAFAIFSYFVLLLPVSQIIPHHELLADHYLYLPMMSFGLTIALVVQKITLRGRIARQAAYAIVGLLLVVLCIVTFRQNRMWQNERTLWTANYQAVPNSPRAALNLGNTYQDTDPATAEALFKRALDLNPTPEIKRTLYDRLAVILIQQGKFDEADFFVSKVLSSNPNDFFGHLWSTQVHMFRKECEQAREQLSFAKSVARKPREISLLDEAQQQLNQKCGG